MTRPCSISLVLALASLPTVALAHHGWSSYDETKPITLTAPLRDVAWSNPHGSAEVRWQDKTWHVVLAPVARMEARGLTQAMISNAAVTLTGYARRDGTPEMRIERIITAGKTIELR